MSDPSAAIPAPPRPLEYEGMDRRTGTLLLVAGVAMVLLGIYLLANPFAAIWILGVVIGAALVLGGVAEVAASRQSGGAAWPYWLAGGLFVIGGFVAALWPDSTLLVLARLAGAVMAATGVVALIGAAAGDAADRGFRLGMGAVSLVIGLAVLAWPDVTLLILAILIGLRTVVAGGLFIAMGWNIRRLG